MLAGAPNGKMNLAAAGTRPHPLCEQYEFYFSFLNHMSINKRK
jgi:hypothetical protein